MRSGTTKLLHFGVVHILKKSEDSHYMKARRYFEVSLIEGRLRVRKAQARTSLKQLERMRRCHNLASANSRQTGNAIEIFSHIHRSSASQPPPFLHSSSTTTLQTNPSARHPFTPLINIGMADYNFLHPRDGKKDTDPSMIGLWKIGRTIGKGSSG